MDQLKLVPVGLHPAYDPPFLTAYTTDSGPHKQPSQLHKPIPCKIHTHTHTHTRTHTQSPTGSASLIEP